MNLTDKYPYVKLIVAVFNTRACYQLMTRPNPREKLMRILTTLCLIAFSCIFCSQGVIQAALPPFHQSICEIEAICKDPSLQAYLEYPYPIESIQRVELGWNISTANRSVYAKINKQPSECMGPDSFTIEWIAL
jgi:hypothetical protein